jgi:hypothetical protein
VSESALELYGVGPSGVTLLMGLVTLPPLGALRLTEGNWVIYSIFWIFPVPLITYSWLIIPLYIFSILYIRQIVRFFNGDSSRDSALMCGIISIIFPTLVGIGISVLLGYPHSSYLYVYPIPIQFLAGLVFLYRYREPENISLGPGSSLIGRGGYDSVQSGRTGQLMSLRFISKRKKQ